MSTTSADNMLTAAGSLAEEHLTDLGNARRLAAMYGTRWRHVPAFGADFVWIGGRWARDRTGHIQRMAKDVCRRMHDDVGKLEDRQQAERLSKWAFKSEGEARLNAMINLARTEADIAVVPEALDVDPWAFNVQNGTLDLRTGQIRKHDPADLITKLAPVRFDSDATALTWDAFLDRIMDGRTELVGFIQRLVGCAMVGEVRDHVLAFFYGLGGNGKTTLLKALLDLFGDYGKQADPDLLISKRTDSHPTGIADLKGARLVTTSEIEAGRYMAESQVKQLTGGDRIKARFMRQDFFEFEPSHTILLAANHKPVVRGTDEAIWRRILLVPFDVTIPKEECDPKLPEKLNAELPGILNWALEGCRQWQRQGLNAPAAVEAATNDYRSDMDTLGAFLAHHTVRDPNRFAEASELYRVYVNWCETMGLKGVSQTVLGRQLRERGFDKGKDPGSRRVIYLGIRIDTGSETVRNSEDDGLLSGSSWGVTSQPFRTVSDDPIEVLHGAET